jgi:hypothetical protein
MTSAVLAVFYTATFLIFAPAASGLVSNYTLDGIAGFFADPTLRLVAWVHYLAFDLWVGSWEAEEAHRIGLPHAFLLLSLALTCLLGPIGLVTFLAARALKLRSRT